MGKFLATNEINAELEKIIDDAKNHILLISPYLQLSDKIKASLERKIRQGVHIRLIYRTEEKISSDINWAKQNGIEIRFLNNLHGKAYCNEKKILMTSMNLYHYSQTNNYEFGILINYKDDEFNTAYNHFDKINDYSKGDDQKTGYCIRTGIEIEFNPAKPFSYQAFRTWSEFANEEYPEKYCHRTGEKSYGKTCFARPILKKY